MNILLGAMALLACSVLMAQGSITDLGQMIRLLTKKNPALLYSTYGCSCGTGGRGQPLDATDRCCFTHKCCYAALNKKCSPNSEMYKFTYRDGNIMCGEGTLCEMETCECDRVVALCFRDNLDSYNMMLHFRFIFQCNERDVQC